MQPLLTELGLNEPQAATYLYLLEHGETSPPQLARDLQLTRTNAYKVLASLEDLALVHKSEVKKKFVYRAADPTALATLVAEKRNALLVLEQNTQSAMQQLRKLYRSSQSTSNVAIQTGKSAMIDAYKQQAAAQQPIYFIRSRADVPFIGFDTMHALRSLVSGTTTQRFGMTPDGQEGPLNPEIDIKGNLTRTWLPAESYSAPVEWSVAGDQLHIHVFEDKGRVITIEDRAVASAFVEIWQLLDKQLRANKDYKLLPKFARRKV